jgi:hypothetical protein
MSNMSYCRFQNTVQDLRDCRDALEVLLNSGDDEDAALSEREREAAISLVEECAHIMTMVADSAGLSLDTDDVERNVKQVIDGANEEAKRAESNRRADEADEERS